MSEYISSSRPNHGLGASVFWHSSAHVLGQAIEHEFGGKLTVDLGAEQTPYPIYLLGRSSIV